MTIRIGMYPNPFMDMRWEREGNPHLSFLAQAISHNGFEVVPIEAEEMLYPGHLLGRGISLLHVHWLDKLFDFFTPLRLLSRLQKYRPFFYRSLRLTAAMKSRFGFCKALFRLRGAHEEVDLWMRRINDTGIPIAWEIHDLLSHYSTGNESLAAFNRFLHLRFYEMSSSIVLHERSCKEEILRFYGSEKPFAIAQLGDYSIVYGPRVDKEKVRERLGIGKDKKVLAYVGTARRNRNPAETFRVFSKIAGTGDALLVAGRGVSRFLRDKRHSGVVVFDRFLKKEEIRDIFCASDFIVNDAKKYLTSAVVRTAMSYGVPIIAYPYGSTIDMAKDAGIFIGEDAKSLEHAIYLALRMDREKYKPLADAAKARNSERRWEQAGVECATLYHQILGGMEENKVLP